jgi:hypothetical protein
MFNFKLYNSTNVLIHTSDDYPTLETAEKAAIKLTKVVDATTGTVFHNGVQATQVMNAIPRYLTTPVGLSPLRCHHAK